MKNLSSKYGQKCTSKIWSLHIAGQHKLQVVDSCGFYPAPMHTYLGTSIVVLWGSDSPTCTILRKSPKQPW